MCPETELKASPTIHRVFWTRGQLRYYMHITHVRHVVPLQLPLLHHWRQVFQRLFPHLNDEAVCPLSKFVSQWLGYWVLARGQQHHLVEKKQKQKARDGTTATRSQSRSNICFVTALTSTSSLCSILMPMVSLELMDTISSPDAERKIRPSVRHPDTLHNIRWTTSGVSRPK